jgi:DNA-binding MarR family transcriptional regulator
MLTISKNNYLCVSISKMKQAHSIFQVDFPLGRRFGLLMRLYFGALTKKLEQLDIERHYSILLLVEHTEGNCNQKYLSDLLQIDKTSMVRMIDYLVDKKYIKRTTNPDDRREHRILLTEKANRELPHIHKAINELNSKATQAFSASKLKKFYKDLDLIAENLTHQPRHTIVMNLEKVKSPRK